MCHNHQCQCTTTQHNDDPKWMLGEDWPALHAKDPVARRDKRAARAQTQDADEAKPGLASPLGNAERNVTGAGEAKARQRLHVAPQIPQGPADAHQPPNMQPHKPLPDALSTDGIVKMVQAGVNDFSIGHIINASNLGHTKQQELVKRQELETADGEPAQGLRAFTEKPRGGTLAPLAATAPGEWERVRAIVDSGASVPAMHPAMGKAYQLQESPASKAGVEYQCANSGMLPNLGEKLMAVMTKEGTLRGFKTQCADVSEPISAVRTMVAGQSAVCFGLGPNGDQHLIINRLTGEINMIEDDGVNYIQELWIVPPDQVGEVQANIGGAQDFPGPGR